MTASYRDDLPAMGKALVTAVEDMMELAKWSSAQRPAEAAQKKQQ